MTRTKRTSTTNNIMLAMNESYKQSKRVCEIFINKDELTNEEKKERIDDTVKRYQDLIQSTCRVLSTLHITCLDSEDDNIFRASDFLDKQIHTLYNELWLAASDIEGYYEL